MNDFKDIRTLEVEFRSRDTRDGLIMNIIFLQAAVYNIKKITTEQVKQALLDGSYTYDNRILMVDMERLGSIFPHDYSQEKFIINLPDDKRPEWNKLRDY